MNRHASIAMLAIVLLAAAAIACGAPRPSPAAPTVPPDIQAALTWFQEHTMQCREAPNGAGPRRWECGAASVWNDDTMVELHVTIQGAGSAGTTLTASLDATDTIGKELCPDDACDPFTGFFSDTIAMSPILGARGPEIGRWIEVHRQTGGQQQFGPIALTYRPGEPVFTITIVIAASP